MSGSVLTRSSFLSWEGLLLFALCTLDMISSAALFQAGLAVEANPLLRPFAEAGPLPFIAVKLLTYVPAIAYVEWLRRRRPQFASRLLRFGAIGYAAVYLVPALVQTLG